MKHLILVEDDPAIRDSLAIFFESIDVTVTIYHNGDAILSGDYKLPDLFLLDKQLSGVDGLDICRSIKSDEKSKHIPVIMMSASPSVIPLATVAGADDVIMKPFNLSEMQKVTGKYLQ